MMYKLKGLAVAALCVLSFTACNKEPQETSHEDNSASEQWERYMYVDHTDTVYNNAVGRDVFCKYLRDYGFTGVYLYSTREILSDESNYAAFGDFMERLDAYGVKHRAVAAASAFSFQTGGRVANFNASQLSAKRRVNRANLEREWWNGDGSWEEWIDANRQIANATIADNDFYIGWYRNLGSTIDTVAAAAQASSSDRILLHCYQKVIPSYNYANAQSEGATCGRLDIIAKGARDAGKRIDLYIIISAEDTLWGAENQFSGPLLAAAAVQPNPYRYIEAQAYENIHSAMTDFQRQWIDLKGFVWFTKRYCYQAVPPSL